MNLRRAASWEWSRGQCSSSMSCSSRSSWLSGGASTPFTSFYHHRGVQACSARQSAGAPSNWSRTRWLNSPRRGNGQHAGAKLRPRPPRRGGQASRVAEQLAATMADNTSHRLWSCRAHPSSLHDGSQPSPRINGEHQLTATSRGVRAPALRHAHQRSAPAGDPEATGGARASAAGARGPTGRWIEALGLLSPGASRFLSSRVPPPHSHGETCVFGMARRWTPFSRWHASSAWRVHGPPKKGNPATPEGAAGAFASDALLQMLQCRNATICDCFYSRAVYWLVLIHGVKLAE